MFRTLLQAFVSPVAGPVGFILALAMCGLLVDTVYNAETREADLRGQIAQLSVQAQRNAIALHARLAACEATPVTLDQRRADNARLTPEQRAQRLAANSPQGFDVCARMESADRAVLETLK
jgi:predicted component of type VI protein secretion system